ncbi:MAG: adenylosuccinate lyase [Euryarchaeota archaeon]|nr:adenylosuccinate lyase [Euryarchaeota archaeon]
MSELVCPLDFRYGRPEMKTLFSEASRLRYLLEVEAALTRAHARLGHIPQEAADTVSRVARNTDGRVRIERVKEIEAEIRHDLMAVVKALSEQCGDAGRYVHLGATSYDIIDTANALQFKEALTLVRETLVRLGVALARLAKEHRDTVMLGRTHGQMATPITFGLKMAVFLSETLRHIERLDQTMPRMTVGKMVGPTGSGAGLGDDALELQDAVMQDLGLTAELGATQIVQRDRYVEMFALLANIATSCAKFATEVRNLQRSEIDEVREAFDAKKQVGSSAMPHKQNPIVSEQVSGLSRLVRANIIPTMEDAVQWHERDLANSSAERFLNPHTLILTDWILVKTAEVFEGLRVFPDNMQRNLERTQGLVLAERFTVLLTEAGMGRQDAHEATRLAAMRAIDKGTDLGAELKADPEVKKRLGAKGIDQAMDYATYTGVSAKIVDRVLAAAKTNGVPVPEAVAWPV